MIWPVKNWENWYSAQGYGNKTSYGYHEGEDINLKTGGDTDLGQPLLAIASGEVTSIHSHLTSPTFGRHVHIRHDGPWGTVWCHYAHCDQINVKEGDKVNEGQVVATVGKTGTTYAHCHWAIKKEPTGVDGLAKTLEDLDKWLKPIDFVTEWKAKMNTELVWLKGVMQEWGVDLTSESSARARLNDIKQGYEKYGELEKKIASLQKDIEGKAAEIGASEERLRAIEQDRERLNNEIKEKNRLLSDKETEIFAFQRKLQDYEGKVILTQEEYDRLSANKVLDRFTTPELIKEILVRILKRK